MTVAAPVGFTLTTLRQVRAAAAEFAAMYRRRDASAVAVALWLEAARRSELAPFVTGIERDRDAVVAVLCFGRSTSQVESQVHRLKVVKRSMYGRAKFNLLRRRMLHAA